MNSDFSFLATCARLTFDFNFLSKKSIGLFESGRARGCALARARKVHRSNAEVPRVEGGGAWPGPDRPCPARPGCSVPRARVSGGCPAWSEAGLAPGLIAPPAPARAGPDCTARACARADGAASSASSAPSLLPAPVAAASAGTRGRHHGRCTGEREQRAGQLVRSCHEFEVHTKLWDRDWRPKSRARACRGAPR